MSRTKQNYKIIQQKITNSVVIVVVSRQLLQILVVRIINFLQGNVYRAISRSVALAVQSLTSLLQLDTSIQQLQQQIDEWEAHEWA